MEQRRSGRQKCSKGGEKLIRISQLKLPITHTKAQLEKKIAKTLKNPGNSFTYEIKKQSLDCRHKNDKIFVYTVDVTIRDEQKLAKKVNNNNIMLTKEKPYEFPSPGETPLLHSPVIVGSGPAGLFCGWYLAKAGYCPIILERGEEAEKRQKTVENFWKNGVLDPESNVQFGEGGAGTFSDGKLNTLVKDPYRRNHEVLKRFVAAGAPEEIIYQQKPHLGTDVLVGIVEKMRHEIEEMGGKFCFRSKVTDLIFENNTLKEIEINNDKRIPAQVCVLAPGHSARDTFEMLQKRGVYMEPKSFAVGLRIEHPQEMINMDLYGEPENELLGAASYKVTHKCANGRGVYSFCMCPGGYVVNASSEEGMLAVNGMSYQARDSHNANSAVIVTVNPSDFPEEGIRFTSSEHKKAYYDSLQKFSAPDSADKALCYCINLMQSTRSHVTEIFDFEQKCLKTKCLKAGWQTSSSEKAIRMAFNLFSGEIPTVDYEDKVDNQLKECQNYTVNELFYSSFAPYFWQAVQLRYPEYTK